MKTEFVQYFRAKQEDYVYEGKNNIVTWLVKFTWNPVKQKIEYNRDLEDSMLLVNEMVLSFC